MLNHIHRSKSDSLPAGNMEGMAHYYDAFTTLLFRGRERQMRAEFIRQAQIQPGSSVLDVGCGTGTLTLLARRAAGPQARVEGIDVAPSMVEVAQKKAREAGLEITFRTGKMEDLPVETAQFDVVLSSMMLHHLDGDDARRKGLGEARRALKPGGVLMIAEFQPPSGGGLRALVNFILGRRMAQIDNRNLVQMLEQSGFSVEELPATIPFITFIRARAQ